MLFRTIWHTVSSPDEVWSIFKGIFVWHSFKRTLLFLIKSYHLLLVVELDSCLQINNCNRSVIWHTRNGLLPIMYALMATLLSLSSSQLQTNQSGWFSSEENSCNDLMLLILSFTVHSEMLWVMLFIWCYKCSGVWSCTAPCLCSELLWKWWWDAWAPWVPSLFKVFPSRSSVSFDPRFALLYRRFLHV